MNKVIVLGLCVLLFSCAATKSKFSIEEKETGYGRVLGILKVTHNGEEYTEFCNLQFNEREGELYRFSDGPELYHSLPVGKNTIWGMICNGGGFYNIQHYIFDRPLQFTVKRGNSITYIGHIEIDWKTASESKLGYMFGLIGYLFIKDDVDGFMKLSVKDKARSAFRIFNKSFPRNKLRKYKSIVRPRFYRNRECQNNCP